MIEEEKAIKWECVGDIISTKKNGFLCPTQALLARWLREKYNVHVIPKPIYDSDRLEQYGCDIHCPDKNGLVFTIISPVFPVYKQTSNHNMTKELGTYEESMEAGLQEALKLIRLWIMEL